ncbi:MAG: low molecular weight phosphatase family protein [Caldilineaceae bacterium]
MQATVLFLCTGNYYRSRFAEILFNHGAAQQGINWMADSRGLATELGVNNVGPISRYAVAGLRARQIPIAAAEARFPAQLQAADLATATLTIALDETEHRPYMTQRFPAWLDRIDYWRVADLGLLPPTMPWRASKQRCWRCWNGARYRANGWAR